MSASKKNTSKPSASPAPATKSAAKATAKPAAKKSTVPPVKAAVAAPAAKPAPLPTPVAAKPAAPAVKTPAPAVKPVATKPLVTTINARIDVGFGNALFVRGEGSGLSWDQGRPMECVEDDLWRVTLAESATGFTFKFLINDVTWSVGPDFTAATGATVTLTPEF